MIAYFDTSAIIPLLIDEPLSELASRIWRQASWVATARITYVEARSGLARACRTGRISPGMLRKAVEDLDALCRHVHYVEITADLVARAGNLAEEVALRAYDAVQLASAASLEIIELVFMTGDRQLASAARRIGLASISDPRTQV